MMSIEGLVQALVDIDGGAPGREPAGPYLVAFLSSRAVEVIAVAALLAVLVFAGARTVMRSNAISHGWRRLYRALDVLKLSKLVIPLGCLSATVWIWTRIQGA